jgi:hypothetical protein
VLFDAQLLKQLDDFPKVRGRSRRLRHAHPSLSQREWVLILPRFPINDFTIVERLDKKRLGKRSAN